MPGFGCIQGLGSLVLPGTCGCMLGTWGHPRADPACLGQSSALTRFPLQHALKDRTTTNFRVDYANQP